MLPTAFASVALQAKGLESSGEPLSYEPVVAEPPGLGLAVDVIYRKMIRAATAGTDVTVIREDDGSPEGILASPFGVDLCPPRQSPFPAVLALLIPVGLIPLTKIFLLSGKLPPIRGRGSARFYCAMKAAALAPPLTRIAAAAQGLISGREALPDKPEVQPMAIEPLLAVIIDREYVIYGERLSPATAGTRTPIMVKRRFAGLPASAGLRLAKLVPVILLVLGVICSFVPPVLVGCLVLLIALYFTSAAAGVVLVRPVTAQIKVGSQLLPFAAHTATAAGDSTFGHRGDLARQRTPFLPGTVYAARLMATLAVGMPMKVDQRFDHSTASALFSGQHGATLTRRSDGGAEAWRDLLFADHQIVGRGQPSFLVTDDLKVSALGCAWIPHPARASASPATSASPITRGVVTAAPARTSPCP
jgi:hypothetical protein